MNHRPSPLSRFLLAPCAFASMAFGCATLKGPKPPEPQETCVWSLVQYQPSQWEREWYEGEISGDRRDRECERLASPVEVDRSVRLISAVQGAVLDGTPIPEQSFELFSRMVYAQNCGPSLKDDGRRRAQLIEPLVGILRDPLTICERPPGVPDGVYQSFAVGEGHVQSKRHFLIGAAAPWSDTPDDPKSWQLGGFEPWASKPQRDRPRARMNFLMDIGASTYGNWNDDPTAVGALWFVERYQRHKLSFDWIVSFEYKKIDPENIFRTVPADLLPHYIYYDQPVEKDPNGKWNPWRILRGMGAVREDYVVVKLDIDMPEIENSLVDQLMKDSGLRSLVDEVFFEHHVNTKPMHGYWGMQDSPITLKDTYQNFTALRSQGIRMHSWP